MVRSGMSRPPQHTFREANKTRVICVRLVVLLALGQVDSSRSAISNFWRDMVHGDNIADDPRGL